MLSDEGLVAFTGDDGQPFVIPMAYARQGDRLLLHGWVLSRLMQRAADGVAVCVTVTLLDGLVLARSVFRHSMNYRSAVVLGRARPIRDRAEKLAALEALVEHLVPGRTADGRGPSEKELAATEIVAVPFEEASVKVRTRPPKDDRRDLALPVWAGVVPLCLAAGAGDRPRRPPGPTGARDRGAVPPPHARHVWSSPSSTRSRTVASCLFDEIRKPPDSPGGRATTTLRRCDTLLRRKYPPKLRFDESAIEENTVCQRLSPTHPILITLLLVSTAAPAAGQKFFPAVTNPVDEHYTVLLDPGTADAETAAAQLVTKYDAQVTYLYQEVLHGFDASMSEANAISMSEEALVRSIHQDSWLPPEEVLSTPVDHCYGSPGPTNTNQRLLPAIPPCGASMSCVQTLSCPQPGPDPGDECIDNWGLDRIDQVAVIDEDLHYRGAATNVSVYVLDYGIRGTNREFLRDGAPPVSRVALGEDVSHPDACESGCPPGNQDCLNGHGSHVAGIIGGRTFGLAKDATLVPIRYGGVDIPPCEEGLGAFSSFRRGLDRIAELHPPSSPTAVVNISGANVSEWVDVNVQWSLPTRESMINLASRDNILIVQSAGNQGSDACDHSFGDEDAYSGSDAAAIARIVVAAGFDPDLGQFIDTVLPDNASNWGPCVDIWAPAADIVSSGGWLNDPVDDRVCRLTGTSMAAPQVSGVAAVLLGEAPFTTSDQLKATLVEWATYNTLGYAPGHPIGPGSPNARVRRAEGIIFEDGFNFDRSRWNGEVTTNGATLSICPEAAMPSTTAEPDGAPNGLCVGLPGTANAQGFVKDHRPVAETKYYASFFAHFGDLSMQPNDSYVIFDGIDLAGPVFRVRHRGDGFVRVHAFDNAGGVHFTEWIDYGVHAGRALEISWQAGSPGFVTIGVSGLPLESVSLQNSTRRVEEARLGAVAGVSANTSGVLRIDTFGSWTEGFRGMGGYCHPAVDIGPSGGGDPCGRSD